MEIAIMGAGALGCYYGGMLARAGHAVTLIGRPTQVEAVRRDGLFLDTQSFQTHLLMQASTDTSGIQGAELVLCASRPPTRQTRQRKWPRTSRPMQSC
jgi:2-dehydropantoate 2-reductase